MARAIHEEPKGEGRGGRGTRQEQEMSSRSITCRVNRKEDEHEQEKDHALDGAMEEVEIEMSFGVHDSTGAQESSWRVRNVIKDKGTDKTRNMW